MSLQIYKVGIYYVHYDCARPGLEGMMMEERTLHQNRVCTHNTIPYSKVQVRLTLTPINALATAMFARRMVKMTLGKSSSSSLEEEAAPLFPEEDPLVSSSKGAGLFGA